ncbi:MAG: endonuclease/exonuclease/phosphatase family protein [Acidobacteriota bacterium]
MARTAAADTGDIVLFARRATVIAGAWSRVSDASAAGGERLANPDAGVAKRAVALASPADYFELKFTPVAGRAYRLWIRSRAQNDSWTNDSVFVQFSNGQTVDGAAAYRIGTTSAMVYSLEEASNAGESGWGWQDNGYGLNVLGEPIYFDGTPQTIRIQAREDGISIDQIVLSPVTYATTAPGAGKNDTTILAESVAVVPTPPATTPAGRAEIVIYANRATVVSGAWSLVTDATAAGGARLATPDAGVPKLLTPLASPVHYFDLTFTPEAGRAYHLWIRSKAQNDSWTNDSVFVQFSGAKTASGAARYRIGTASAMTYSLEEAANAGESGWGWQDDAYGYGALGESIYFDGTVQTIRVQGREDGLSIDQIVLSSATYAGRSPGAAKNDTTILAATDAVAPVPGPVVTPVPVPTPVPTPTPTPTPTPVPTGSTLRVLEWNTHHGGFSPNNTYDPDRLATFIVSTRADVVMLTEIEKFTGWGNQDQPALYKALLEQKTGRTWYSVFGQEFGQWDANGKGNLILSTYPLISTGRYELMNNYDRNVVEADITVNGRNVTLLLTHLDPDSPALRLVQAKEITSWAGSLPQNRILAGDFNAWPDQTSIAHFNTTYYDSWTVAAAAGTATSFVGNTGETKNGRIDYIMHSKQSTNLFVTSSQVFDTRDANGMMASDHRPLLTIFEVR